MDAIWLMIILFLDSGMTECNALPAEYQQIAGREYRILRWSCHGKDPDSLRLFRVWEAYCDDGGGYWSRPFLLEERSTGYGFYMNRFGEIHGSHNAEKLFTTEVYIPQCGA